MNRDCGGFDHVSRYRNTELLASSVIAAPALMPVLKDICPILLPDSRTLGSLKLHLILSRIQITVPTSRVSTLRHTWLHLHSMRQASLATQTLLSDPRRGNAAAASSTPWRVLLILG